MSKAEFYIQKAEFDSAQKYIDIAANHEEFTKQAKVWFYRSFIYKEQYKTKEKQDLNSSLRSECAISIDKLYKIDTANTYLTQAEPLVKYIASTYYNDAARAINNEDYKTALIALEEFVYENPQSADGWNYIGFVSRNLEKYEDAERYYALGLEIKPNHKGILEYQGELYLKTDRIEKARENLSMLNDLCSFNCSYRDKLAKKIKAN